MIKIQRTRQDFGWPCHYQLVFSILWHYIDIRVGYVFKGRLGSWLLIFVDILGFLGFLALLICGGVIVRDYGGERYGRNYTYKATVLLTYSCSPWMICWWVRCVVTRGSPLVISCLYQHCSCCSAAPGAKNRIFSCVIGSISYTRKWSNILSSLSGYNRPAHQSDCQSRRLCFATRPRLVSR